jgi:hypothetical protein
LKKGDQVGDLVVKDKKPFSDGPVISLSVDKAETYMLKGGTKDNPVPVLAHNKSMFQGPTMYDPNNPRTMERWKNKRDSVRWVLPGTEKWQEWDERNQRQGQSGEIGTQGLQSLNGDRPPVPPTPAQDQRQAIGMNPFYDENKRMPLPAAEQPQMPPPVMQPPMGLTREELETGAYTPIPAPTVGAPTFTPPPPVAPPVAPLSNLRGGSGRGGQAPKFNAINSLQYTPEMSGTAPPVTDPFQSLIEQSVPQAQFQQQSQTGYGSEEADTGVPDFSSTPYQPMTTPTTPISPEGVPSPTGNAAIDAYNQQLSTLPGTTTTYPTYNEAPV